MPALPHAHNYKTRNARQHTHKHRYIRHTLMIICSCACIGKITSNRSLICTSKHVHVYTQTHTQTYPNTHKHKHTHPHTHRRSWGAYGHNCFLSRLVACLKAIYILAVKFQSLDSLMPSNEPLFAEHCFVQGLGLVALGSKSAANSRALFQTCWEVKKSNRKPGRVYRMRVFQS